MATLLLGAITLAGKAAAAVGGMASGALVGTAGTSGAPALMVGGMEIAPAIAATAPTAGLFGAGGTLGATLAAPAATGPLLTGYTPTAAALPTLTAPTLGGAFSSLGAAATKPFIAGQAWSNPLMLGAAGLGLAQAFGSQGQAFQDKIELSKEGEQLEKDYRGAAVKKYDKAIKGDVSDRAFADISAAKSSEGIRSRMSDKVFRSAQAQLGNVSPDVRGSVTAGGNLMKAAMADTAEGMTGKFEPASILNNYRKEELVNATKQLQNLYNIENQTAVMQFNSNLAAWQANQARSSQRGAALGQVAQMIGGAQMKQAYLDRQDRMQKTYS